MQQRQTLGVKVFGFIQHRKGGAIGDGPGFSSVNQGAVDHGLLGGGQKQRGQGRVKVFVDHQQRLGGQGGGVMAWQIIFQAEQAAADFQPVNKGEMALEGGCAVKVVQLNIRVAGKFLDEFVFWRHHQEQGVELSGQQLFGGFGAAVGAPVVAQIVHVNAVGGQQRAHDQADAAGGAANGNAVVFQIGQGVELDCAAGKQPQRLMINRTKAEQLAALFFIQYQLLAALQQGNMNAAVWIKQAFGVLLRAAAAYQFQLKTLFGQFLLQLFAEGFIAAGGETGAHHQFHGRWRGGVIKYGAEQ